MHYFIYTTINIPHTIFRLSVIMDIQVSQVIFRLLVSDFQID